MSTRCQVQVIQEGLTWDGKVTLYHHCDGYPTNILPLIRSAFGAGSGWQLGRAGKAAGFLCASDPGSFEPEEGHDLHGDIEYYYKVYLKNTGRGSLVENPIWEVEVYTSRGSDKFWKAKKASIDKMKKILERTSVLIITPEFAEVLEKMEDE